MTSQTTTRSKSFTSLFHFYRVLLVLPLAFLNLVSAFPYPVPRLSTFRESIFRGDLNKNLSAYTSSDNSVAYYYIQTLDHFNYAPQSYATFRQRYVVDFTYWGGASSNSPIFVLLGAEEALEFDMQVGFVRAYASHFKALQVYIEHRYYGKSVPFGMMEEAMNNANIRGFFNSAQALADYAELILHIKEKFSAQKSPVIVVGGSYGGMLAAWFRLKYPHLALGALASSAPLLYFDNITPQNGYYSVITKDFKEESQSCYETIRTSWSEIDKVASLPYGLTFLSRKFRSCRPFESTFQLKNYLDSVYSQAAQYNAPPRYPVSVVCRGIDREPVGTDILSRIAAGVEAFRPSRPCHNINEYIHKYNYGVEPIVGWAWQTCSEMVMPIGRGRDDTMFPPAPFDFDRFSRNCYYKFGVRPRPHWITTYFGGHDIKLILRRFGSNIIFSNGLKDPYSSAGVLEDISDSIIAVSTVNGSHCLDISPPRQSDPQWLVEQRNKEVKIIDGWLAKYYADID